MFCWRHVLMWKCTLEQMEGCISLTQVLLRSPLVVAPLALMSRVRGYVRKCGCGGWGYAVNVRSVWVPARLMPAEAPPSALTAFIVDCERGPLIPVDVERHDIDAQVCATPSVS